MKFLKRNKSNSKDEASRDASRITNDSVAEHRQRVLAGGRKFKYPLQYTKHRLVWITLIVISISLVLMVVLGWWRLYIAQSTSRFMHSVTHIVPLPVASVEDTWVPYRVYLTELRSSLHYLSTKEARNFTSADGKRELEHHKRVAMDKAIEITLVSKLAKENNISVSRKEVDDVLASQINNNNLGASEETFKQVIKDYYDLSLDDYRNSLSHQILRKKVLAKIDTDARRKAQSILDELSKDKGKNFAQLAAKYSEDVVTKTRGGDIGTVDKRVDDPTGLVAEASRLKEGQVSGIVEGIDGLYILKLTKNTEQQISFSKILISYHALDSILSDLKSSNKIKEYIKIEDTQVQETE